MAGLKKSKLLVVAHPDDETIFFAGLVMRSPKDFHIICVTDGNADGRGQERKLEFENACKALGADSFEMLDFPDIYEKRLDTARLVKKLKSLGDFEEVYSHNPLGEYGHPHHQDVCWAAHAAFKDTPVHSPAYNNFPDKVIELSQKEFAIKEKALTKTYGQETQRFLNILPVTFAEGFAKLDFKEVDSIYQFLCGNSEKLELSAYAPMEDFIRTKLKGQQRIF